MDRPPADDRSAISLAWAWATRVIVIAAEMVVPGLVGYWLDRQLGLPYILMLIGFALGMTAAAMQLIRIASAENNSKPSPDKKPPPL